MVLCAGLPYGLLATTGSRYAPAVHMGVLMAGAMPLFTALFAWLLLPWLAWLLWQGQFHLFDAPPHDLIWQALWQGVLAGLLGLWTFNVAIRRLGAAPAAAFGALTPVVSALGGWWWLGERLNLLDVLAVSCAVLGVALASGVMGAVAPTKARAGSSQLDDESSQLLVSEGKRQSAGQK